MKNLYIGMAILFPLSGCGESDGAGTFLNMDPAINEELKLKGYATKNGQIFRVAAPSGSQLKRADYFLPGDYVLQGYDTKGRPEFTDTWPVRENKTLPDVINQSGLYTLQGRMALRNESGKRLYSGRNCEKASINYENYGIFSANSICEIPDTGMTVTFTYKGAAKKDGFTIDVARSVSGGNYTGDKEKKYQIISHIKTDSKS